MSAALTLTQAPSIPDDSRAVHQGYKQTGVGVIPEDWTIRSLLSCLRSAPNYGINAAAIPFDDALPTYLRITDISEDNQFRPSPRVSVRHPSVQKFFLNKGDLVFARTGASVGKSYLYNPNEGPLVFAGFLIRVSPNPRELQPVFLAYCVQSKRYWNWVATVSIRSGQPGINGQEYGTLQIPLPGPAEQRAIAEALSDVDGLMGALEALIAKKRAIKQAAMQQLLTGKTRLPGFSGEWETKRIGDFTDCTAGGTPSTFIPEYWGGTIRWMNSGELNNKIVHDVEGLITEQGLRESSTKTVPPRCVLIGLAGQGKTRGTVAINTVELCTNQSIAAIYPNESFVPEYLYHNLDARYEELRGMSTGNGGRGGLNLRIILSIAVPFPHVDEQHAIAAVLSDMDAEIAALERRRDKTRAIKHGMMQQLLTGRVRLVQPEMAAEQTAGP